MKFTTTIKWFFILLNLVTAITFWISVHVSSFNQTKYGYLGILTLGSLYFLVALVAFIVLWLIASYKYTVISLLTIIICYSKIQNIIQLRQPKFTIEKPTQQLRVLSWNVELLGLSSSKENGNKQEIVDLINSYSPDVICLQEVVASTFDSTAIVYLPDLMKALHMPYYNYVYKPKYNFDYRHHFGILIASKFPLLNKTAISNKPHSYNSIFEYADVVFSPEHTVRVFNVHLESLHFTPKNMEVTEEIEYDNSKNVASKLRSGLAARRVQADNIRKSIDSASGITITCGDFNDVPNSYAYATILGNNNDAFVKKGSGISKTFTKISGTLRIDYIFGSPQLKAMQYNRIKRNISDHYPIVADFEFSK